MGRQKSGHGWLEVDADLLWHPKVFSSARLLEIPKPAFLGLILGLWGGAAKHAEDGDLWRGSDEESVRFIASVCDLYTDAEKFIEVLRMDRWLDGWIVHDWLDYRARYLISKWSSHYRDRLVATWAKHGRMYGKAGNEDSEDTGQLHLFGEQVASGWEVVGNNSDPPITLNPITLTLNPNTLKETKKESPMGRSAHNATNEGEKNATTGSSITYENGSRVQGYAVPVSQAELTGAGLTHKEVFEAFMSLFVTHAVLSLEAFYGNL